MEFFKNGSLSIIKKYFKRKLIFLRSNYFYVQDFLEFLETLTCFLLTFSKKILKYLSAYFFASQSLNFHSTYPQFLHRKSQTLPRLITAESSLDRIQRSSHDSIKYQERKNFKTCSFFFISQKLVERFSSHFTSVRVSNQIEVSVKKKASKQ